MTAETVDVLVIGGGPAGLMAALRAGALGARTVLVTRDRIGGMAAEDGPVPVRTLAHAARLLRDARQLGRYGITVSEPVLDYPKLLHRVREVVSEVRTHSALRPQLDALGVTTHENAGMASFADPHTVVTGDGLRYRADKIVLCTGGVSRRLPVPGSELTATHADAFGLLSVPESMLVIGAGATGVQVASVFNAFGTRVTLFEAGPRILSTEDEDVAAAVADAFRDAGITVRHDAGRVESFEKTASGVRMTFSKDSAREATDAALAVVAIGWSADTATLGLAAAGVETDTRGFVRVDAHLRTSAPHVFAAGDVTGRLMLAPQALHDGFLAGTNAVRGRAFETSEPITPIGSFTDPEYAHVGLTEAKARAASEVVATTVRFDATTRAIMDGQTRGFCKLVVERPTRKILGCHVVGERAVDIVQTAAVAIAAGIRVDALARIPLSFPTYAGILARAAATSARQLEVELGPARSAEML
jgi:dihydrolipoamide dehydrogenase